MFQRGLHEFDPIFIEQVIWPDQQRLSAAPGDFGYGICEFAGSSDFDEDQLHAKRARRLFKIRARLAKIGINRILQHSDALHRR